MNSDLWTLFIDEIHLLLGMAETDEAPLPYLERLSGDRSRVYAACEYLAKPRWIASVPNTVSC